MGIAISIWGASRYYTARYEGAEGRTGGVKTNRNKAYGFASLGINCSAEEGFREDNTSGVAWRAGDLLLNEFPGVVCWMQA